LLRWPELAGWPTSALGTDKIKSRELVFSLSTAAWSVRHYQWTAVMKGGSAYAGAASRYLIFDNDKDETNEFQT